MSGPVNAKTFECVSPRVLTLCSVHVCLRVPGSNRGGRLVEEV